MREHGFTLFSLSRMVKDKAEAKGLGPFGDRTLKDDRRKLQDFGDALREPNPAVLAEECSAEIRRRFESGDATEFVVDSIRNPEEVNFFRDVFPNFYLVAVLAPRQVRFDRIGKELFGGDLSEFEEKDDRDSGEDQPKHGQKVRECVDLADFLIDNSSSCKTPLDWTNNLWSQVDPFVRLVREPGSRTPTMDELYMEQAYAASRSSTCSKRHVGAAIVHRDAQPPTQGDAVGGNVSTFLISTGANHVPAHRPSCKERGEGDSDYCTKDQGVLERLRSLSKCPRCGADLDARQMTSTSYVCPNPICSKRIARECFPGRQLDLCIAVHAEEASILQAAKLGSISLKGTTLYTTTFPCLLCAKKVAEVGIERVVYAEPYPMAESWDFLNEVKAQLVQFRGVAARSFFRLFR